jgi:cytochrome P450
MTNPMEFLFATSPRLRDAALTELAAAGPVHQLNFPDAGTRAWLVTGFAEARAALNDARLVKSAPGESRDPGLDPEIAAGLQQDMLAMDPPDHTRLRRLVTVAFTRRSVERLEPAVAALTSRLLDDVERQLDETGEADVLASFAQPLPFTVICDLLGIPPEDRKDMQEYQQSLGGGQGDYPAAARAMLAYVRGLVASKRAEPADDLLSALVQARDEQDRLSEDELTSMVQLLFVAGHETTVSLLANGILALLTNPGQYASVREEPALWPAAVEELLRYDSPVTSAIPLFAAEALELGGQQLGAGDMVLVSVMAANRDGKRFDDPTSLRLTRETAGHLAFGHGIHHCVGAPLARMEGRVALSMFAERFGGVRLAAGVDDLRLEQSMIFNKLTALPIRRS